MRTEAENRLLGALVGLARAAVANPKTPNTDNVILAALAKTEPVENLYQLVAAEKNAVAPNCAFCTARCGNTDDYDLSRLAQAPADVRAAKEKILARLPLAAARRPQGDGMLPIYQGLYALAEDWEAKDLLFVAEQL